MKSAEKERLIKSDILSIESQVRHAFNQGYDLGYKDGLQKNIKTLPPVTPQPKAEQFAKWVAGEIFDDMWEYNKDAFAEIACRKLAKLGIVIRMGDEWELIDPQESEEV